MSNAYSHYMPSADDFIMLILGISELYDGHYAPTAKRYDLFRPCGWPVGTALLRTLGYSTSAQGWREFMIIMVELPVIHCGAAIHIEAERRARSEPKQTIKFEDAHAKALYYEWPWNGKRERG